MEIYSRPLSLRTFSACRIRRFDAAQHIIMNWLAFSIMVATAVVALRSSGAVAQAATGNSHPSALVIEASVLTEFFGPTQETAISRNRIDVHFWTSGDQWRVRTEQRTLEGGGTIIVDCRTIHDGIRLIIQPPKTPDQVLPDALEVSQLYAVNVPPPEIQGALLSWITYMRPPHFPRNGSRVRRFLPVQNRMFEHKKNIGDLDVRWYKSAEEIVESLVIRNNGTLIVESGVIPMPRPFNRSYKELEYRLDRITNSLGLLLPAASSLRVFAPLPNAQTANDVFISRQETLTLGSIRATDGGSETLGGLPAKMAAYDSRFPGIAKEFSINYLVTNDSYSGVTDPGLQYLARIEASQNPAAQPLPKALLSAGLLVLLLLPLVVYGYWRWIQTRHQNNNP